ncbi:MFS transporter [Acetobacter cibinongensis]|uniref:MFS transporter n=1 Tax=Acetobacter cibinongensis TaxID=146475 RepID=A0A1Z5YSE4_9PROT|nr:MFS transporter [Acetobacter cibinongensis]OUJ01063.1 MFS transporter [Acetobacter cibinongensis]
MPPTHQQSQQSPSDHQASIAAHLIFLIAAACGLTVANLYYAQPLSGLISAALGMPESQSGLIVTVTQLGYCLGLLLIVPLADLLENRSLIVWMTRLLAVALLLLPFTSHPMPFLLAIWLVGLLSVSVQILVPFAAHLAPIAIRGRVVGNVMSGLMLGIMLARPVASLVAHVASWRAIFLLSAGIMLILSVVLGRMLPSRQPTTQHSYAALLRSMGSLLISIPALQRRAFYHACMFGAFSLFWTVTPLLLAAPPYGLTQGEIAVFALVGVAGAISAPLAGRIADRGWIWPATLLAMAFASAAFLATWLVSPSMLFVVVLAVAGVVIDFCITANLVLGQRVLFVLAPEHRARLNALYMALFFVGGALGSAVGGWAYAHGGWALASTFGAALPALAFIVCLTEKGVRRPS